MRIRQAGRSRRGTAGIIASVLLFAMLFTVGTSYFLFMASANNQYAQALISAASKMQGSLGESLTVTTILFNNGDLGFYVNNTSSAAVNITMAFVLSSTGSVLDCNGVGLPAGAGCGNTTPALWTIVNTGKGSAKIDTGFVYVAPNVDTVKIITARGNAFSATYPPTSNQNSVNANTAQSLTVDPTTFKWTTLQPSPSSVVQSKYSSNCNSANCGLQYNSQVTAGNTLVYALGWYNLNPPATPTDTLGSTWTLGESNTVTYTYTPARVNNAYNPNCGASTCGNAFTVSNTGDLLVFGLGWFNQNPPSTPTDTFGDTYTLGTSKSLTVNPPAPSLVQSKYTANCGSANCALGYSSAVTQGNTLVYGLGWYGPDPYVPVTINNCPSQSSSIVLVQHGPTNYRNGYSTLPLTLSSNVANGDLVVLMFNDEQVIGVSSVSGFGVNSWSLATSKASGGGGTAYMYYGISSGGSSSGTVTFNGNDRSDGSAAEFSGIASSNILDGTNTSGGSGTTVTTGSITTTNAKDLILAVEVDSQGYGVGAATNNFTNLDSDGTYYEYASAYNIVSSTGTYSTGWTIPNSATWGTVIAAFKAATGGSGCGTLLSVDGSNKNECDNATSCTISVSTNYYNEIVYLSLTDSAGGNSVNSLTDTSSLTWNLRGTSSPGSLDVYTYWAYAPNPMSDTITAQFQNNANLRYMVISVTGANVISPFDPNLASAPNNSGTGSTTTVTVTTTNANDIIIGTVKGANQQVNNGAGGYTAIIQAYAALEYKVVAATGSYTPTFTLAGSSGYGEVGDAIQAGSGATPSTFQQMVTWNPSMYSSYEAADLGNIRFCADAGCATPLNGWLESCTNSCAPSATSATAWVKLTSSIAWGGQTTIYMMFYPTSVEFDGNQWGEAPNLSSTYGQYDNGANVFTAYFNGNTAVGSFSVRNGYTLAKQTGVSYGAGTISVLKLTGYHANDAALVLSTQLSNTGMVTETNFKNVNYPTDSGLAGFADNSAAASVSNAISTNQGYNSEYFNQDYMSGGTVTANQNNQGSISSAAWLYASTTYFGSSANSYYGYLAPQLYSTSGGYSGTVNANPTSGAAHLYLGYIYTTNSGAQAQMYYNWGRARIYPPSGWMPLTTFGSVTGGNPLSGIADTLGDAFTLGATNWVVSGSSTYFSYIWYTTAKSSSADTITTTFNHSLTGTISIYELAGYSTAGVQTSAGSNPGSTAVSVTSFTPSASSFVIGNVETTSGSSTFTPGTSYSQIAGSCSPSAYGCSEYLSSSSGAQTVPMTLGASAGWAESAISFPLLTTNTYYSYLWYATAGNTGTDTISAAFSQSVTGSVSEYEFSGLTTAGVLSSTGSSAVVGSSATVSPSISPSAGSVVVGNVETSSTTVSAGSGYTLVGTCTAVYGCGEYQTGVGSSTTVAMGLNPSASWVEAALAFAPAQTNYYSYIWYAPAASAGTDTVTATFSQSVTGSVAVYELNGYSTTGITISTGSNAAGSTTASVTSFTPGLSSVVIALAEGATTTFTAGSGYGLVSACSSVHGCSEYETGVSVATTASLTLNPSAPWVESAIAFRAAPAVQSGIQVGGYPSDGIPYMQYLTWTVQFSNQDAKGRAVTLWPKSLAGITSLIQETVEITPFFIVDGVSTDGSSLIQYNTTQDFITIPYKATATVTFGAMTPLGTTPDRIDTSNEIAPFTAFFALEGIYSDKTLFSLTVPYPAGMVTQANAKTTPIAGTTNAQVTVSCTSPCNFNPSASSYVGWLDSTGHMTIVKYFAMNSQGNIPAGITFSVPAAALGYYTLVISDYVNTAYVTFQHT